MYGLIGKMTLAEGKRDAFVALLEPAVRRMPGNVSYVLAQDADDANVLWVTEVWETRGAHEASLKLPAVQEAIAEGRAMIEAMERIAETVPVAGKGT